MCKINTLIKIKRLYVDWASTVTGWGRLTANGNQPSNLQEVVMTVRSNAQCNRPYRGAITPRMVCAEGPGRDACYGDSGGNGWKFVFMQSSMVQGFSTVFQDSGLY